MNIETKPRTLVAIGLAIVVLISGYFYMKRTAPERAYQAEIKKLRLVSEHQALEIEIIKQKLEFATFQKGKPPVINLTPQEPN